MWTDALRGVVLRTGQVVRDEAASARASALSWVVASRSAGRWLTLVYAAVALAFAAPLLVSGLFTMLNFDWSFAGTGDCQVDWAAAKLFLQGKSPYTPEGLAFVGTSGYGFGHPPTTAFWFLPLARYPFPIAAEILAVITLILLVVHVVLCVSELRLPAPIATSALCLGLCLSASWMVEHFHIVQVSEVIAFAYVLAWYALRRDREALAGAVLGAACTLKLYPGLMVVFLLVTRRWLAFAVACVTYAAIAAFMTHGFGLQSWKMFFDQQGPIAHYWEGHIRNASSYGVILRMFRPSCERAPENAVAAVMAARHAPPLPGATLATLTAVALVIAGLWLIRRSPRPIAARTHAWGLDLQFALFTVLSGFANPWAWEHYAVLLIMPLLVCTALVVRRTTHLYEPKEAGLVAGRKIAGAIGQVAFVAGCLALSVFALSQDIWTKERRYFEYWRIKGEGGEPPRALHWQIHFYETLNFAPWVALIVALGALLLWSRGSLPLSVITAPRPKAWREE
jgi:hypothetical protein